MTIYYAKNYRGLWKASLNRERIASWSADGEVRFGSVPLIRNAKVYLIKTEYGVDPETNEMVEGISGPFYSVNSAKKSDSWLTISDIVAAYSGSDTMVSETSIMSLASDMNFEHVNLYDDCFNTKIIGVELI